MVCQPCCKVVKYEYLNTFVNIKYFYSRIFDKIFYIKFVGLEDYTILLFFDSFKS